MFECSPLGRRKNYGSAFLLEAQHDTMAQFPARGPKVLFDNAAKLPSDIPTLARVASDTGIETAAIVARFVLDERFGFDRGFGSYGIPAGPRAWEISRASRPRCGRR